MMSDAPLHTPRPKRPVWISPITTDDYERLAHIRINAFEDVPDALTINLYPPALCSHLTREQRVKNGARQFSESVQKGIETYVKATFKDTGEIAGWAIWLKPGSPAPEAPDEDAEERARKAEEEGKTGVDVEFLRRFKKEMKQRRQRFFNGREHWYLALLVVDTPFQNFGVGQALLDWGIDQAASAVPAVDVYLEASPAGQRVYKKKGFKVVDWCEVGIAGGGTYKWPCMLLTKTDV